MSLFQIIGLILLSGLSFLLYRIGGGGQDLWKEYQWLPKWLFNTKARDTGCALVNSAAILLFWQPINLLGWLMLFVSTGLLFWALTTYNKWAGKLFGYPTNDVYWPSWIVTGFLYGAAAGPLAFAGIPWQNILYRALALALFTVAWSEIIGNVTWEEGGRGASIPISVPIII